MATKSLVTSTDIDVAIRSHNCQGNAQHRIQQGDTRLKVKNGRGWDHYCVGCARKIVAKSQASLDAIVARLP